MSELSHLNTREIMKKNNIDALLINEPHNIHYMSGWKPMTFTRPIMIIVPLESQSIMILPSLEFNTAKKYAYKIQKFIKYSENEHDVLVAASLSLKKIINKTLKNNIRLGIEENHLSTYFYKLIKLNFPKIELIDASTLINEIRMIKSVNEINLIKKAATFTEIGLESSINGVKIGKNELELLSDGMCSIQKKGSVYFPNVSIDILGVILSGYKTADPHENTTGKKIKKGEIIKHGWLCTASGYWASCARFTCAGRPKPNQSEMFEAVLEAQKRVFPLLSQIKRRLKYIIKLGK